MDHIQNVSEITKGGHIQIHVSKYGTSWALASTLHTTTGQSRAQTVLKEIKGLMPYAKRNVGDNLSRAWRSFMDETILRHKKCTEAEGILRNEEN